MPTDNDLETLQTFLELVGGYTYYSLKEIIDKPNLYLLSNDIYRFCREKTIINDSQDKVIEIEGIELTYTKYNCNNEDSVDVFDIKKINPYILEMMKQKMSDDGSDNDDDESDENNDDENNDEDSANNDDESDENNDGGGGAYRGGTDFSRHPSIYSNDLTNDQREEIKIYKKNIQNTNSSDTKTFVVKLLSQLKSHNDRCFYKGAFVFADTKELDLTTMLFNETATFLMKAVESHKKYCSKDNNQEWYKKNSTILQQKINNKNGITILDNLKKKHVYEVHISPTHHSCSCDNKKGLEYQNVKWYPFIGGDGNNYVFLKLEGYPTMELLHLWHWIVRHGREKTDNLTKKLVSMFTKTNITIDATVSDNDEQTNKYKCATHREDCSPCSYSATNDGTNNNYVLISDNDKGNETINNYPYQFKRDGKIITRGDEIFVPESMLRNLLNLSSSFKGGRRKTRSKAGGRKTRRKAGGRKTRRKAGGRKTRRKAGGRKTRRKN